MGYDQKWEETSVPSYESHENVAPPSSYTRNPPLRIDLTAPPKAAFAFAPTSPAMGSPRAVDFGDAPRTPRPKQSIRPESQINWSRFSVILHRGENPSNEKYVFFFLDLKEILKY